MSAGVAIAGCGGSSHHAAGSTPGGVSTVATVPTAGSTSSAAPNPGASSSTTGTPPPATTGTQPTSTTTAGGAQAGSGSSSGARIPATFTIKAGQPSPPSVNAPALVAIQITIASGDGKAHTALIRTSPPHTLHVAAGGRASLLLPGQQDGRYVIVLDHGAGLATLLVGGAPGP